MNQKKHCKSGFTLSDVLVALVIIGIIAALTVPAIMNNTNKQELRSAFKKSVSGINRALLLHYSLTELSAHDYTSADLLVSEIFEKRMNVIHLQEGDENKDTSFTSEICDGKVFILNDGMIYCISNFMSDYNDEKGSVCDFHNTTPCTASDGPNLWIDVNGERKPNTLTTSYSNPKDIYTAQIYSLKVIPYGDAASEIMWNKDKSEDNDSENNSDNNDNGNSSDNNDGDSSDTPQVDDDNDDNDDNGSDGLPDEAPDDPNDFNFWNWLNNLLKKLGEAAKAAIDKLWNDYINGKG